MEAKQLIRIWDMKPFQTVIYHIIGSMGLVQYIDLRFYHENH